MQLIEDWKESYKFWSVRLGLVGTALVSLFLSAPEAALYAWSSLPSELKSVLPPEVVKYSGVVILLLSFFARLIRQNSLEKYDDKDKD